MNIKVKNAAIYAKHITDMESQFQKSNKYLAFELNTSGKIIVTSLIDNTQVDTLDKSIFGSIFNHVNLIHGEVVSDDTLKIFTSTHLHNHSEYSILDGANTIKNMTEKYGYSGAITDHGVMYGTLDFFKSMSHEGKKPIIGFEAYTCDKENNPEKHHLMFLVKDETGYKNCIKLCSEGQKHLGGKFPAKPLVSHEDIKKYSEGLICLSACIGGEIPQKIIRGDIEGAREVILEFKEIFGEDFYLEIQRHGSRDIIEKEIDRINFDTCENYPFDFFINEFSKIRNNELKLDNFKKKYGKYLFSNIELYVDEPIVNKFLLDMGSEYDIKVVATNDAHYTNVEDADMHEVLLCNQTKKTIDNPNRMRFAGTNYHILSTEEMETLYGDIPEVLYNTLEVEKKCNYSYEFGNYKLPKFPIPDGMTDKEYLTKLAWDGFKERYYGTPMYNDKEYRDRLEYELEVIFKMGYQGYFFIVWDYIRWAKENGIAVGPGRGSGAGSDVLYCLHITEQLDPLKYGLLFERFLNPDRISMPDIDVDFEYERREEVINYCRRKYGAECVSSIVTFGRMQSKQAILDVARIYNYSPTFARTISKYISKDTSSIGQALGASSEFNTYYETNDDVKKIVDMAIRVEGLVRNTSVHACGKIIAPSDVSDYCPQCYIKNEETGMVEATAQLTMGEVEEIGLLKMDFLGLRTESIINGSIKDINALTGSHYTLYSIPIADPKVYINLAKGKTTGVFQLESPGITSVIKELFQDIKLKFDVAKSDNERNDIGEECFERLIAGISLYRPGPMDEIPRYIDGMLDEKQISYDDMALQPILANTYGVIVYQEQVMQIVRALSGFTAGQADTIRKAMGKKKIAILNQFKPYFIGGSGNDLDDHTGKPYNIKGCVSNNIPRDTAITIWDKMESFAKYAFNKSHGAAYAVVAAQTAWLSYYYPIILMKNSLNSYITSKEKVPMYLNFCRMNGIKLLPPSVNNSMKMFSLEENSTAIRFGLRGIKSVNAISDTIINEREAHGLFKSFEDFVIRMSSSAEFKSINSKALESLIMVGAFDEFPLTRAAKVSVAKALLETVKSMYPKSGSIYTFARLRHIDMDITLSCKDKPEFNEDTLLDNEEAKAGVYISGHPLMSYQMTLSSMDGYETITEILDHGDAVISVITAGIVKNLERIAYKSGNGYLMKFTLKDLANEIPCICFDKNLPKNEVQLVENKRIILKGKYSMTDFGAQIEVGSTSVLSKKDPVKKEIILEANDDYPEAKNQYDELQKLVLKDGNTKVFFKYKGKVYNKEPFYINLSLDKFKKLQEIFPTVEV